MPALATSQVFLGDAGRQCPLPGPSLDDAVVDEFARQLDLLIEQHKSYPSIVAWVIYNEGWGQRRDDPGLDYELTARVKARDATRLVDSVTGWHDHGAGDFHVSIFLLIILLQDKEKKRKKENEKKEEEEEGEGKKS